MQQKIGLYISFFLWRWFYHWFFLHLDSTYGQIVRWRWSKGWVHCIRPIFPLPPFLLLFLSTNLSPQHHCKEFSPSVFSWCTSTCTVFFSRNLTGRDGSNCNRRGWSIDLLSPVSLRFFYLIIFIHICWYWRNTGSGRSTFSRDSCIEMFLLLTVKIFAWIL